MCCFIFELHQLGVGGLKQKGPCKLKIAPALVPQPMVNSPKLFFELIFDINILELGLAYRVNNSGELTDKCRRR